MAKQKINKKNIDSTKLIFLVSYALVTFVAFVFVLVLCVKPFKITSYEDLKQVEYKDYTSQKADEYYVFIYSEESSSNDWYVDVIVQYANKARTLSNYLPIYGYDYDEAGNGKILTAASLDGTPALLHIKSGSVSKKYTKWAEIRNILTDSMEQE